MAVKIFQRLVKRGKVNVWNSVKTYGDIVIKIDFNPGIL